MEVIFGPQDAAFAETRGDYALVGDRDLIIISDGRRHATTNTCHKDSWGVGSVSVYCIAEALWG